jgi:heme exporter protein C
MPLSRRAVVVYLGTLYLLVLGGMYGALFRLGPLSDDLLRYPGDPMRHGYKVFFFAMQNAPIVYLAFLVTLIASLLYLRTKDLKWDALASHSAKLALFFTTLVLVNGALFSKMAWGAYWNWDPRQTTTLILWFILAAYLSLRSALEGEEARARLSAILGIFGFVGVPLTHLSATLWVSNHPQLYDRARGAGFSLDPSGLMVFLAMFLGSLMVYGYLLWVSVRLERIQRTLRFQSAGGR